MRNRNYENSLPRGYRLVKKMDAADLGFGLLLTFGSLLLFAVTLIVVALPLIFFKSDFSSMGDDSAITILLSYLLGTTLYMILHELTHGAAYKALTGEKLTFGISWNCAFCGVPNVFTYRRTSLIAVYAPFVVFTLLLIPALIWSYFYSLSLYIILALIFATHVSGCIGDLYMGHILLHKYTGRLTLVNDSGPCVTVFVFDETSISRIDEKTQRFINDMKKN